MDREPVACHRVDPAACARDFAIKLARIRIDVNIYFE